jgi:hypothetical protein
MFLFFVIVTKVIVMQLSTTRMIKWSPPLLPSPPPRDDSEDFVTNVFDGATGGQEDRAAMLGILISEM